MVGETFVEGEGIAVRTHENGCPAAGSRRRAQTSYADPFISQTSDTDIHIIDFKGNTSAFET